MHPTIANGETIIIEPVDPSEIRWGDIILYRTKTGVIAHRVISILRDTSSVLSPQASSLLFIHRGDAFETPDEPVRPDQVLGRVVSVERNGHCVNLLGKKAKILFLTRILATRVKGQIGQIPIVAHTIRHIRRKGSLASNL